MLQINKILSVSVAGLALLMFILSTIIAGINRKKLFSALALSIVYSIFAVYYLYLSFFFKTPVFMMKNAAIKPQDTINNRFSEVPTAEGQKIDFFVVIQVDNDIFNISPDDEIEIKKDGRFKIKEVKYPQSKEGEDIKADLKGFAGNVRFNDGQDIGYWITYKDMMQHWSIEGEKDKFELVIKRAKKPVGRVYIKFID